MADSESVYILTEIKSEDERTFSLGDTLDIKASIWLVIITFLAGQTAYFLSKNLSPNIHRGQILSAVLLGLSGLLTLIELRPVKYDFFSPSNGVIEARLAELREWYKENGHAEHLVQEQIIKDQIEWTKKAIFKNQKINKMKMFLVDCSFWFTAIAAVANLLTLVFLFKHPS